MPKHAAPVLLQFSGRGVLKTDQELVDIHNYVHLWHFYKEITEKKKKRKRTSLTDSLHGR